MHLLGTLFIGFVVGLVARFLHPGNDKMGIILTTVLGIGGAYTANYLGQRLGLYRPGESAGFLGAVIGAIVLLVAVGLIRRVLR